MPANEPVTQSNIVNEYRLRLPIDSQTSCTITGQNEEKVKQLLRQMFNSPTFESKPQGTLVTYKDVDNTLHSAWIARYHTPEWMSVTAAIEQRRSVAA